MTDPRDPAQHDATKPAPEFVPMTAPEPPAASAIWWEEPQFGALRSRQEIEYALQGVSPRRRAFDITVMSRVDGAINWLRRHWLATVNVALGLFIGVAVLAPIGTALGFAGPSSTVFQAYHFACGQVPSHSFFIFGYQVCLCSRCLAIYSSMLLTGLVLAFARTRRDIRGFSWRVWLLAMVPMALDGGTQLFGWRESTVWLRLLTGIIFGIGTAWFLLPQIDTAAREEMAVATR